VTVIGTAAAIGIVTTGTAITAARDTATIAAGIKDQTL
jgi:hypothetical protein